MFVYCDQTNAFDVHLRSTKNAIWDGYVKQLKNSAGRMTMDEYGGLKVNQQVRQIVEWIEVKDGRLMSSGG